MVDKTSENGMGSWQPAQGVGNWGVSKAAPEGQGGAPGQRPIRLKNGVPQVDPYPDSSNDGFIPIPPEIIQDADEIMTSEPLPQLDTIRPADMRTLLIRDPRVGNNQSILGFYDPVRDVTPATKGAPAPDTQGVVGDPWVDLGDNGREYPINLNDPAIRKLLQHLQATFPEIGFFPGATDINKIGKDELPSIREPGDLDKHLIINHAVEVDTTVYPIEMIDELHIQMHAEGQASDHNPEVLKVANILDPIQETLDPKIWDEPDSETPKLKPSINSWIKQAIFGTLKNNKYKDPENWIKLIITGSITTYQWSEESDLDVSIWVDLKTFSDFNRSEMIKIIINELDGSLVPGTNHPIQCFVVDVKSIKSPTDIYKIGVRSAYSLDNNEWLVKPERARSKHVPSQFPDFFRKARQASAKMKLLLQFDKGSAKAYWHFLHKRRREDMRAGFGDYSESNIVYKMLANDGLFDDIAEVTGEYIAFKSPFKSHLGNFETNNLNNLHDQGIHEYCRGPWCDIGELHRNLDHSQCDESWCGALIYHNQGNHFYCYSPWCETGGLHRNLDHSQCDESWCKRLRNHEAGDHHSCKGPWCKIGELHQSDDHSQCDESWCYSLIYHNQGDHGLCKAPWCETGGLHRNDDHSKCDESWCDTFKYHNKGIHHYCKGPWCEVAKLNQYDVHSNCDKRWCGYKALDRFIKDYLILKDDES